MNIIDKIFNRKPLQDITEDKPQVRKELNKVIERQEKSLKPPNPKKNNKGKEYTSLPPGRVSEPTINRSGYNFTELDRQLEIIKPDFVFDVIPKIRKLYKVNEDVGLALFDSIQLTNTGHDIKFDPDIPPLLQDEMRAHLRQVSKGWHTGSAGIDGLVNKWIAQIYVSGALSTEWVLNKNLTGVDYNTLVNPENIRFHLEKGKYKPLQKLTGDLIRGKRKNYIKLNPNTYFYYGLYNDTDLPYGVPPFLSALKSLNTQADMKDNINHILNQLGLLGYLEVTLDKPQMQGNESEDKYVGRLNKLLKDTKRNILQGFKEGVVVGYTEDHSFDFHSTTKNLNGVTDLFSMNENQIANGLKTSPALLGVNSGSTESFLSIVFTKTLSQLKNVQKILAMNLEEGYRLELMLAGYNSKKVKVEFKPSTVTDDLKVQQGKEIRQRVLRNLWIDRIISQDTYAEEMGYSTPHKSIEAPDPTINKGQGDKTPEEKEKREKDKDKSDRKVRDKNKPQPKRKDNNTKPI